MMQTHALNRGTEGRETRWERIKIASCALWSRITSNQPPRLSICGTAIRSINVPFFPSPSRQPHRKQLWKIKKEIIKFKLHPKRSNNGEKNDLETMYVKRKFKNNDNNNIHLMM